MKNIYIILILFFSFTIYSCAKKSDSSTSSTTTELEGTWVSTCYSYSYYRSTTFYYIDTVVVSGSNVTWKEEAHNDSNCSSDNYTRDWTYSNGLSIGDAVTFESGTKTGAKFTLTMSGLTETLNNSYEVTLANNNSFCGYSDWELNVAKDVAGKTCGPNDWDSVGTKRLSIYKNESSTTIKFATFNLESSGYAASVNSLVYTKQ